MVGPMTPTLQIQPIDPAAPSTFSLAGRKSATDRRSVRPLSIAAALAIGVLFGSLISMSASSDESVDTSGEQFMTESVAD